MKSWHADASCRKLLRSSAFGCAFFLFGFVGKAAPLHLCSELKQGSRPVSTCLDHTQNSFSIPPLSLALHKLRDSCRPAVTNIDFLPLVVSCPPASVRERFSVEHSFLTTHISITSRSLIVVARVDHRDRLDIRQRDISKLSSIASPHSIHHFARFQDS